MMCQNDMFIERMCSNPKQLINRYILKHALEHIKGLSNFYNFFARTITLMAKISFEPKRVK